MTPIASATRGYSATKDQLLGRLLQGVVACGDVAGTELAQRGLLLGAEFQCPWASCAEAAA